MTPREYLDKQKKNSLEELKTFVRIPSISAQSQYKPDMERCARWLVDFFKELDFNVEICETGGHPLVYSENLQVPGAPTVLIYGHYDVQPVDPVDLWQSPPFEPTERDGYLYARGVVDDKGQIYTHMKSVQAYLKTAGKLPLNVKFLIEGEEEGTTSHLDSFIEANSKKLQADIVLVSDSAQYAIDMPAINYGLRGIAMVEVKITGPEKDLHSGSYGGSVANPIHLLAQMIGQLHDKNGRISIAGFYDNVYTMPQKERKQLADLPFDAEAYRKTTGVPQLWGEKGFTPLEQIWCRPTLDCNGITGGYQGEGAKTIIPSWASAKITMRLVPDQTPDEVCDKFEAHMEEICPKTVRLEVQKFGGANPVQVDINNPWVEAAARAVETGFDKYPLFIKMGGSIPVVETFKRVLGLDTLLVGFGQEDDNPHSPNERFLIKDFHRGCQTAVALLDELAKVEA